MNPAEILRRQHFLILRGVVLTRRIARRVRQRTPGCARDAADLLAFFRLYVLEFHASLEDELVFPWLQAAHPGPLPVSLRDLYSEHQALRHLTDEVDRAVHSDTPEDSEEVAKVLEVHAGITEHHVRRENQLLLPLVEGAPLPPELQRAFQDRLEGARPLDAQASEMLERIEARLPRELSTDWH